MQRASAGARLAKIDGPLMDRIDIHIDCFRSAEPQTMRPLRRQRAHARDGRSQGPQRARTRSHSESGVDESTGVMAKRLA